MMKTLKAFAGQSFKIDLAADSRREKSMRMQIDIEVTGERAHVRGNFVVLDGRDGKEREFNWLEDACKEFEK